ncbi:YeiH family protein, partial [Dissulfurispira sp.]|uniref:YeiH family protein n=1 Tax=Dissulfurispira sp. TaxID=2817609 RepID=UPI002FDB58C1
VGMWAGIIVSLFGIWNLVQPAMKSKFDKVVRAPMAGAGMMIILAYVCRFYLEPLFKIWGKAAEPALGFDFATIFGLNYILLGILLGIIWVNTIGIPGWMQAGVKTSRLAMKMGVITLGAMYSITELRYLGSLSVVLIATFVMGTVILVLWLGQMMKTPRPLTGVLSAGMGVCGVSAAVAAAPVVKARGIDMAYSIGMLLLVGVVGLFTFPPIARIVGMNELQFGAWAGTGILNSAQVAAAALIFDPNTIETLKVAEIFNITRILFLPFIVILLAVWFAKGEEGAEAGKISLGQILIQKFPIFVIGFILMFAFSSTGVFTPKNYELHGKHFYNFTLDEKKELRTRDLKKIQAFVESGAVTDPKVKAALEKLVADRQITSSEQTDLVLKAQDFTKDKDLKAVFKEADKKVQAKPKTLETMREYMMWFFAFGLIGLGMQITWQTIRQAGGKAAVIGVIAGASKAILSFFAVWLFVKGNI